MAGKGDKPRPVNRAKWDEGYQGINWGRKVVQESRVFIDNERAEKLNRKEREDEQRIQGLAKGDLPVQGEAVDADVPEVRE